MLLCCMLMNANKKKKVFLKPAGGVISCCHCFQIKYPCIANEMGALAFS